MSENLIGATTAVFPIRLSVAVSTTVDVEWSTRDGSAVAGSDYKAAAGTVTFLPGETEKQIEVQVYGQSITPADDKVFFIRLNPPSNAVLVDAILTCTINIIDDQGTTSVAVVVAEGRRGPKGDPGLSAYEQAVLMGYTGTLAEWMDQIADASKAADRAGEHAVSAAEDALKAQNAAKNAVFAGVVFPTAAEGVDPILGVNNGAYFNVRSPLSEHYIDEYQNVNGVAVATGKSYPTSDHVQNISEHTALPFVTGTLYKLNKRVVLTNGDIVKSTIDGNSNDPNVGMTGWVSANAASQIFDASGMTQQEINDNGFVLVDSRKLGLVGDIEDDQASAVAACNNYVNAIPVHKDTPIVLRLPKGLVRSSMGFTFDRQTILFAEEDTLFDYTGNGYAVRLGKLGEVDSTGEYRTFGIKGVSLTGGDNCEHGVYIAQYVLSPVLDNVKLVDFGNPNNSNSFCLFFQGHNWDIYIRNSKGDWTTKNKVNLIRVNGVLTDGTPDYGNSRLNILDSFYNQGFNASAGIGVYINSFKSRFIGGGFQGFKTSVQFGEYAQTVEINGTYFETIYQDCESVFKLGEDGYTSEKTFSDLSLLNIYANLHNENNEFGNTNVKFLTTANNVKLSNLKIDNIKTLNGSKHPLLNLQEVSGQTCDVGNVSHGNALLHNIRDDQMVVMNASKNYIHNSDFRVWQRGNSFTFNNGKKHLADGYTLLSDGTTGVLKVYDEPLLDAYNFNANAHGMMRLVRESATDATYNTLRIRVGELEDLAGQFATFSFAAKADAPFNLTATFVQDYGGGNIEYKSLGSITIDSIYTLKNFARSFFVPSINRSTGKTGATRSYIDIALPLTAYVLDLSCITLEAGLVRKGWSSNSYSDELEFAKQYYQFGSSQSIQDQTRVQLDLRPVMRYSPASVVHVNYQDAVVDYNANINISDPDRIVYTLNARSQDVSVSWTADAEL